MQWVVAVPNYAAHVGGPGGSQDYAFAGINDLRDLFVWLGLAMLPLSLTYASTRAMFGLGDHAALPVIRTLAIGVVLISYTWLWGQVAAICNQITKAILGVPTVADGINRMFDLLTTGAALGGLPLIGLIVMGAAGIALLASIFVKVLMILVGAIVYVTGPLMIGVAPTERGAAAARAWLTLAIGLFVLPILWATVFAIAALLMNDSSGAASIIGTDSDLGKILGGLVLGLAAIAGFWLNLKLTKFAAAILGGQIAGMLALASGGGRGAGVVSGRGGPTSARQALSSFGSRVSGAARGAAAPLASSGRVGSMLASAGGGAGALARGGLLGAGGGLVKRGAGAAAASPVGQAVGSTKAGALATRMARSGRTGWKNAGAPTSPGRPTPGAPGGESGHGPINARGPASMSTRTPPPSGGSERSSASAARRDDRSSPARGPGAATTPSSGAGSSPARSQSRSPGNPPPPASSRTPPAGQAPTPNRRSRVPRPQRKKDR